MSDTERSASSRLEELGYAPQLRRRLHVWHVVGLAMADVSPTMAVVFFSAGVFSIAGTFAIGIGIIQSIVVVLITLCLAELAAMFPIAGGMYSLVRHVLPKPLTWITMFNFLLQGVVLPASIALGIPPLLRDLVGGSLGISDKLLALILLLVAMGIALTKVEIGARTTVTMVVIETVVLSVITIAALTHPHQSLSRVTFHPVVLQGSALAVVAGGLLLASVAAQFNVNNGYDASLGFAEELRGGERAIAKSVIISGVLAGVLIMIPLISAIVAAPDLKTFLAAPVPVVYTVQHALGSGASKLVDIGATVALFNAMLSLEMYMGRAFYTTGRDGVWPPTLSRWLASLNRFRSPGAAIAVMTIPGCVLIFMSALNFLIVLGGTIIAAVYLAIGVAALWSRFSQPHQRRPYRMPLWPLPPLVVIGFTGIAVAKAQSKYLIAELVLAGAALVVWALSRLWEPAARAAVAQVIGVAAVAADAEPSNSGVASTPPVA